MIPGASILPGGARKGPFVKCGTTSGDNDRSAFESSIDPTVSMTAVPLKSGHPDVWVCMTAPGRLLTNAGVE